MNDAQGIFEALVNERGGLDKLNATELAIANKLATLLADNADVPGSTISALMSLLPKPLSADAPVYDLSKLTDKEFAMLDKLTAKAAGLLPPSVEKPRRFPLRSDRERWAAIHAVAVDQIEAEKEAAFRARQPWSLSEDDRLAIYSACELFLGLIAQPGQIWPHIAEEAAYRVRKEFAGREELAAAAAVLAVPAASAAAPKPELGSNVVKPAAWGARPAFGDFGDRLR
jgi:hypothetical protein